MELDLNKKEKTPTKPLITIVRGFPGSGKTLFGRSLAARQNGLFVEPDIVLYDRDVTVNKLHPCSLASHSSREAVGIAHIGSLDSKHVVAVAYCHLVQMEAEGLVVNTLNAN